MLDFYELTDKQQAEVNKYLKVNDYDWYAVIYEDKEVALKHNMALSSILQCGHDPSEYGIIFMQRCGDENGRE